MSDIAMQTKCIYCGREQYAPAVYDISHGNHPCAWCGETPPVLTDAQWRAKLNELNQQ